MKKKEIIFAILMVTAMLGGCGKKEEEPIVDLRSLSIQKLEEGAKMEGKLESVAMPCNWANWEDSWNTLSDRYQLEHNDTDMSSAEEIALFEAEKDSPTKDIGDIGLGFAMTAKERGVLRSFTTTTWDSIPDWAKDSDGKWVASYTGTTAFTVNTDMTGGKVPTTWKELMEGDYVVSPGNVIGGAAPQTMVVACAIANGGSIDNVQPGIDYFQKLAKQGRIDPGETTQDKLAVGEIQVLIGKYDFSGLGFKEEIEKSGGHIEVVIPSDGAVQAPFCLCINQYAPHPHAAALAVEYMLSNEGQIDRARGYARPIRQDVELPEDVKEKMLPDSEYDHVVVLKDGAQLAEACAQVSCLWEEKVLPYIH